MAVRDSAAPTCHLLLSLIDEALEVMRCLTYVSSNTLEKIEQCKGVLDPETFAALSDMKTCCTAYQAASGADIPLKEKEFATATWRACRLFSTKAESLRYFFASREDQAPVLQTFYKVAEQFRRLVVKRLTTTLEEESAINAYLDEVFRREERAVKDHATLSQQLKADRDERSGAFDAFKLAERDFHDNAQAEKANALALLRQMQQEFDTMENDESKSFAQKEKKLTEECEQLRGQLEKMQEENRTLELTLRGKKEQSGEEVSSILVDYEADIAKKKDELDRLAERHKTVDQKMKFYTSYYEQRAREEKQRQEEADAKARNDFKLKRNAMIIQRNWRIFVNKKKAEEIARKKREKAEAKKKKKK